MCGQVPVRCVAHVKESTGFRQVKTFQRGPQQVLRSADPELACQEVWAHLAVHHCLTRIKYSFRKAGHLRRPTRRVAAKVLTLHPATIQ